MNNPLAGVDPSGYSANCDSEGGSCDIGNIATDDVESVQVTENGNMVVNTTDGNSYQVETVNGNDAKGSFSVSNGEQDISNIGSQREIAKSGNQQNLGGSGSSSTSGARQGSSSENTSVGESTDPMQVSLNRGRFRNNTKAAKRELGYLQSLVGDKDIDQQSLNNAIDDLEWDIGINADKRAFVSFRMRTSHLSLNPHMFASGEVIQMVGQVYGEAGKNVLKYSPTLLVARG